MDGNRRYGRSKLKDPIQGHWLGGQRLVDFVQWCIQCKISCLTVYAFSSENWSRDPNEVNALMTIFVKYAETLQKEALERDIKVRILSTDFNRLSPKVQEAVTQLEAETMHCSSFQLNICLSYGARDDILKACGRIVRDISRGVLQVETQKDSENRESDKEDCHLTDADDAADLKSISKDTSSSELSSLYRYSTMPAMSCDERGFLEGFEESKGSATVQNHGNNNNNSNNNNNNNNDDDDDDDDALFPSFRHQSRHQQREDRTDVDSDSQHSNMSCITGCPIITSDMLQDRLVTAGIPSPDILIRTSGEKRISNFLLWEMAYTELFFVDKYWPELTRNDFDEVLSEYSERQRRFGA